MSTRGAGDHVSPSQLFRYGLALRELWAEEPLLSIREAVARTGAPATFAANLHARLVREGRVPRRTPPGAGQRGGSCFSVAP